MQSNLKYKNLANVDHPATIIYLIDISRSMGQLMPNGKPRIEIAKDVIGTAYAQMIQRSLRQGKIHPRYRVGMIAYTSDLYDVYDGIITIDKLKDLGVPPITPQNITNMAKAFRYAYKLIQKDIQQWSQEWLEKCPPPWLINLTDAEYNEVAEDPLEFAKKIQEISVPDGNVLVENIFITDQIQLASAQVKDWKGYRFNESTGDPYGDKLLAMSSPIPSGYAQIMNEQSGLSIREGTALMFPGVNHEFVRTGFSMSIVTGSRVLRQRYLEPNENSHPNRISGSDEHMQVVNKTDEVYVDLKKILNEIGKKFFKISIGHPELISKGIESPFVVQLYFEELSYSVKMKIKDILGEDYSERVYNTELKFG